MPLYENVPPQVESMAKRIARHNGLNPDDNMSGFLTGENLENFPVQWMTFVSDARVFLAIMDELRSEGLKYHMTNIDQARAIAERIGLTLCVVGPDQIEVSTSPDDMKVMTVEQFLRVYGGY